MHHHSLPGGLLEHTLETVCNALTIRRAYLLPPGSDPEEINPKQELWTYAVFTGALLHDIGKSVVDQKITLCDKKGKELGIWNPLEGPMKKHKGKLTRTSYKIQFTNNRNYKTHEQIGLLVTPYIVPKEGLQWLYSDSRVFHLWSSLLTGHDTEADVLGEIVKKADSASVAKNLGANTGVVLNKTGNRPLHQKLLVALRYLANEALIPLNKSGAAGFVCGDDSWFVCKRVVDMIRDHLLSEGHTGIPNSNDRIFDILQEHKLIIPFEEKAIWKCRVIIDENKCHELTMLRVKTSLIWPNKDTIPQSFRGEVIPDHIKYVKNSTNSVSIKERQDPSPSIDLSVNEEDKQQNNNVIEVHDDSDSNIPQKAPPKYSEDNDSDTGNLFLQWLKHGLRNGKIKYNTDQSRVHVTNEGLFLVSPGIFKDFSETIDDSEITWKHIQNRFQKLKLHIKTHSGMNIHTYIVAGKRRKSKINGMLIPDINTIVDTELSTQMQPNAHLEVKS